MRPSCSRSPRSPVSRSATRSSTTTSTMRGLNLRPTTPRSPTGSECEALNGSNDKPLIGLTTYLQRAQTGVWDVEASILPKAYLDAVTQAGGIAVLLPPQP